VGNIHQLGLDRRLLVLNMVLVEMVLVH